MRYVAMAIHRLSIAPFAGFDLGEFTRWTLKRILLLLGVFLMVVGVLLTPLPIPLGLPLLLVGSALVVNNSQTAKRAFLRWLRRRPGMRRRFRQIFPRRTSNT